MSVAVLFGLAVLSTACRGWSVRGRRREPPRSTQSLVDHLRRGPSRVNDDVSVVPLTDHEYGFRWTAEEGPTTTTTTPSDGTDAVAAPVAGGEGEGEREGKREREIAFVDRAEFIAPRRGRDTTVGRAVAAYFDARDDVRRECANVLPKMYLAVFLCLSAMRRGRGGSIADGDGDGDGTGGGGRRFAPYLATLPSLRELRHLPIFWTDRELGELRGCAVEDAVRRRREEWEEEFEIVRSAIEEDGGCPRGDFVDCETWFWARSIIASRAFTDGNEPCLVPYVDMMNHVNSAQNDVIKCEWDIDSSGFRLVMIDEHPEGLAIKSVELSYGTHSNSNFLLNYGFSIPNDADQAICDKAFLSMKLPAGTDYVTEAVWEADGIGDCHLISRNITVAIGAPAPMQSLLSLCRVASSRGLELGRMQDAFVEDGATTTQTNDGLVPQLAATLCRSPFSISNEIRAMEMLQRVASDGLRRYRTTLEADDELLQNGSTQRQRWFSRKEHLNRIKDAITVRRAEKQVTNHFYNLASLALRFLKSQEDVDLDLYKGMLDVALESDEPLVHSAA